MSDVLSRKRERIVADLRKKNSALSLKSSVWKDYQIAELEESIQSLNEQLAEMDLFIEQDSSKTKLMQ